MNAPTRPVLRYHGGKFKIRDWVISHFPAHRVYLEPFCGAASVFMAKPRSYVEVLNDLDKRVVNVFRVLRDPEQADQLANLLHLTPYARAEYEDAIEPTEDLVEAARRFIVLAAMGFGAASVNTGRLSGFRVKWSGQYVSCAKTWQHYPEEVLRFTERLQGVTIECKAALELIKQYSKPDVLLYCDPPYVPETRNCTHRSCRYRHDMSIQEHYDMGQALRASQSMVVLSGYPSALYDEELFPDWYRVTCQARVERGQTRTEVLWLNPAAAKGLQQPLFTESEGL